MATADSHHKLGAPAPGSISPAGAKIDSESENSQRSRVVVVRDTGEILELMYTRVIRVAGTCVSAGVILTHCAEVKLTHWARMAAFLRGWSMLIRLSSLISLRSRS